MPKRLGICTVLFGMNKEEMEELCDTKYLNEYEKEIIIRIYFKRQSLNFIADTMNFKKYGRSQSYYSVRSINTFHKDAFLKLIK